MRAWPNYLDYVACKDPLKQSRIVRPHFYMHTHTCVLDCCDNHISSLIYWIPKKIPRIG